MRRPFRRQGPAPPAAHAFAAPDGPGRLGNLLAPDVFDDTPGDHVHFDGVRAAVVRLDRYPDAAYPGWFEVATTQQEDCDIVVHVEPMPQAVADGHLKRDLGHLEGASLHAEREGAVEDAPRTAAIARIKRLRQRLTSDERVLNVTTYIALYAQTRAALEERLVALEDALGRCNAGTTRLLLEPARGLRCTFPSAQVHGDYAEPLSGESVMTLSLFGTPAFTMDDGYWLGINRCDGTFVIHDPFGRRPDGRRVFDNFNGIIGAKSGGGKTWAVKCLAFRALPCGIDIILLDPEKEYEAMARAVGGQIVRLSAGSPHRINPLDIPHGAGRRDDLTEEDDPLHDEEDVFRNHLQTVQGFLDVILAEEGGALTSGEKSMLDAALIETYAAHGITDDPATHDRGSEAMPVLADLMHTLERLYPAADLALRLKRYATGGLSGLFGGHTTIDVANPFTVFTLRDLHEDFWPAAMYLVSTHVWGLAYRDRTRNRLFIVDEMQKLARRRSGSALVMDVAERGRKYGIGIVGASQDIARLARTDAGRSLLVNASWKVLFKQEAAGTNALVAEDIISPEQGVYLEGCDQGQGLFIAQDPHAHEYRQVVPLYVMASKHMEPYLTSDHAVGAAVERERGERVTRSV